MAFQLTTIISQLQKFGLNEKEVSLYLSLRKLGPVRLQTIAKHLKMNRTTTSNYLKNLSQKGFVGQTTINGKKMFIVEEADKLRSILEEKEWKLKKMEEDLPSIIKLMYNLLPIRLRNHKTKVEYFEGDDIAKNIYNKIDENTDVYTICDPELVLKFFPKNGELFYKALKKIKGKMKEILVDSKYARQEVKTLKEKHEICWIDKSYKITIDYMIFDEWMAIVTLSKKPTGIIIRNQRIVSSARTLFELLWNYFQKR